jgi:hypothetical protein
LVTDTWTIDGEIFVKIRDRVVLVNNVTALNKLASEIGRDAIKVINDIKSTTDLDPHRGSMRKNLNQKKTENPKVKI